MPQLLNVTNILDMGYSADGTYQIVLVGKVKTISDAVDSKELRYAKSLIERGEKSKARKIITAIINNSKDENAIAEALYFSIVWRITKDEGETFEKLKAYSPNFKHFSRLKSLLHEREEIKSLISAAYQGDTTTIRFLIDKGVNINAKNKHNSFALGTASRGGRVHVVILLLNKGAAINMKGEYGFSALAEAAGRGYTKVVEVLLDRGAKVDDWEALTQAAVHGKNETVKVLLNRGADVNAVNKNNWTALMHAARTEHIDTVKLLIDRGADINVRNSPDNWTAVDWARNNNRHAIAELILKYR